jgi:hypothetical protein
MRNGREGYLREGELYSGLVVSVLASTKSLPRAYEGSALGDCLIAQVASSRPTSTAGTRHVAATTSRYLAMEKEVNMTEVDVTLSEQNLEEDEVILAK